MALNAAIAAFWGPLPGPLWKWEVMCRSAVAFRFNDWKNNCDTMGSGDWDSNEEFCLDRKHPTHLY